MNKITLIFMIVLCCNAKLLLRQHLTTNHLVACPKTYIQDSSGNCVCPNDKPYVTADNRCINC